ncbi:acyltransferase family protein [Paenibacillus ginsengarvi]|uniref:acyltransferase family protein n=1 Tax=Paenibacillus ginsengarvi TaxID=400777 RepID=UPI0013156B92|nr:acyltransferase [Paenibacillus ginsengarvi]
MNIERYHQLDSIRGLAALFVVFYHLYLVAQNLLPTSLDKVLKYTPLRIFITGNESVIFFFVLSGFVLSLPFLISKQPYVPYIIKRICRIWIPFAVAISFAIVAKTFFYADPIQSLSTWFNRQWATPNSMGLILNHYALIGTYDVYAYDVVLWSLIHEMRISLIFPIIMYSVIKYNWKINIAFGVFLAVVGGVVHLFYNNPYQHFYKTLLYLLMFIIGALIAKNLPILRSIYSKLKTITRTGIILLGFLLYCYSFLFKNPMLKDWGALTGSAILLICAVASPLFSKALLLKPLRFLGKTSYSLYLYHVIIIFSFIHLFYGVIPLWSILSLSFVLSFIISWLAWKYVEVPSMAIGRSISNFIVNRRKTKNAARYETPSSIVETGSVVQKQ